MKIQTMISYASIFLVSATFSLAHAQGSDTDLPTANETSHALQSLKKLLPAGTYIGQTRAGAECRIEVTAETSDYVLLMKSVDVLGRKGAMTFHLTIRDLELGLFGLAAVSQPELGAMTISAYDLVDAVSNDELDLTEETLPRTLMIKTDRADLLQAKIVSGTNPYPRLSCFAMAKK